MKFKIVWGIGSLFLCVLSGITGAYFVMFLQIHKAGGGTLQARRLELTDAKKNIRAVFFVEDDGSVFLRMLSKENVPVVELASREDTKTYNRYTPSGNLVIRDGTNRPVIWLGTVNRGGMLSFSSTNTISHVLVGHIPYGDVVDGHNRAVLGISVNGPNHTMTGLGIFTEDGIVQGFMSPPKISSANEGLKLEPPGH